MKRISFLLLCLILSSWGMAQELMVTGIVTDEGQNPLPGVAVVVKGTSIGVVTSIDGDYSLKVSDPNATLIFSFIGMTTKEVAIGGRTKLDVVLKEETTGLEEVVVVGYGTQKKESVVASISSISADELVQTPSANLTSGLAGKMPGLTVMIKDGELGSENVQTLIRGQATMNSSSPLILVDGVEREMTSIDPYDVESVSILKDASATAVFGVRGANGVILITTKKGLVGKAQVTANANYSLQTPTRLPEPMNAVDYMTTRNSVIDQHNKTMGQNTPLPYSDEVFEHYRLGDMPDYYVDRNFFKELMHKYVPMTKANVNMRGGDEKVKYFASVGYMRQGGPFKTEKWEEYDYDNQERLDRLTYRANIDMKFNKTLKGWLNLSGYLQDKNDPIIFGANQSAASTSSFYYLQLAAYTDIPSISYPDVDSHGNIVSVPGADRTPYGNLNRTGYRVTTRNTINSTIGLQQELDFITKGLSAKAVVSYDSQAKHIRGFARTYQTYIAELDASTDSVSYIPGAGADTELSKVLTQSFNTNLDIEASLNYNRSFGRNDVTGLFLYKQNQKIVNAQIPFNYVGIVGRATFAHDKKYLAEFNFGMNGSEQFASGHRFGFFPSASVGWVITEEDFMSSLQGLDYMKIRASFGQVGNDKISNQRFIYIDDWTQGTGGYFKSLGKLGGLPNPVYQNSIPNELVSWEVANKFNVGVETRFLNNFEWDLDLFYESRNSILITTSSTPAYMFGQLSLPPTNAGEMINQGFESTLGYSKQLNKDWFLGSRLSFSFARNEVLKSNETPLDDTFAYPYRSEGFTRGTKWGYDCLGYFNDQQEIDGWADQTGLGAEVLPGDLKYDDKNGDGVIDEKDKIPMKYPSVPEFNASFTLNASYKGFDCTMLFHGVSNYSFDFNDRGIYDWHGNSYGGIKNYFELHKYAWTEEKAANGGDIRYPRMHPDGVTVSKQPSNYWTLDLRYLRLKNLEFGYTFPKNTIKSVGLEKLRLYFNGSNLVTWDNMPFKYLDPEVNNSLSHPIFSTFNFGANITF